VDTQCLQIGVRSVSSQGRFHRIFFVYYTVRHLSIASIYLRQNFAKSCSDSTPRTFAWYRLIGRSTEEKHGSAYSLAQQAANLLAMANQVYLARLLCNILVWLIAGCCPEHFI